MVDKMPTKTQVIYGILALIVIFITISILTGFFRPLYAAWREHLKPEQEEQAKHNFDKLIRNIESCYAYTASDCICEAFPVWPATFPRNTVLTIKQSNERVELNLSHGRRVMKNATVKARLSAIQADREKVNFKPEKSIDWFKEPPRYIQEGIPRERWGSKAVISHYLYKEHDTLYFIIGKEEEKAEQLEKIKKCS